jgi:hypothetical protein
MLFNVLTEIQMHYVIIAELCLNLHDINSSFLFFFALFSGDVLEVACRLTLSRRNRTMSDDVFMSKVTK